jgi:type I restriction enzyme, S subunit
MTFNEVPLSEYCVVEGGYAYKSVDFKDKGTHKVIKIKNVRAGNLDYSDTSFIDADLANKTQKWATKTGDVLISMTGSGPNSPASVVGRVARVSKNDPASFINQRIGRILLKKRQAISLDFIFYLLSLPKSQNYLVSNSSGSANQANISGQIIGSLPCPAISFTESLAIASIGRCLDDKIENNQRMNETLEEMARAVFKSWFMNFDPVHAKAAGKAPAHMDSDTAALFPSSFGDDGLPMGWTNKLLDEVADFLNGAAMQKFPAEGSEFLPVIKIAELRNGISSNTNRASPNVPEKYIISDGDILFAWSGSLMQKVWTKGKGALNQHLFKVTSDQYHRWFFYYWVDHHMKWFQSIAASKATTMGHIQRKHLTEAKVVVPDHSVMDIASKLISPLLEKQTQNSIENQTLSDLRDTLLPKLISGEIRVADAERKVEAAV